MLLWRSRQSGERQLELARGRRESWGRVLLRSALRGRPTSIVESADVVRYWLTANWTTRGQTGAGMSGRCSNAGEMNHAVMRGELPVVKCIVGMDGMPGVWPGRLGGGANGELLSSNTPSAGVCACGGGAERVVSDGRHTGQVAYNDEEWELDLPITGSSGCGHKFEQSWRHKCGKHTHTHTHTKTLLLEALGGGRPSISQKLSFWKVAFPGLQ